MNLSFFLFLGHVVPSFLSNLHVVGVVMYNFEIMVGVFYVFF